MLTGKWVVSIMSPSVPINCKIAIITVMQYNLEFVIGACYRVGWEVCLIYQTGGHGCCSCIMLIFFASLFISFFPHSGLGVEKL